MQKVDDFFHARTLISKEKKIVCTLKDIKEKNMGKQKIFVGFQI